MDKINRLQDLLSHSADLFPDKTAIVCNQNNITYKQLHLITETLFSILHSNGIKKGDRVAIYSQKSIDAIACIFGILKSDAAYIPIDSSAPIQRNKLIIDNCNVSILIIEKQYAQLFEDSYSIIGTHQHLVFLKNQSNIFIESPENLAYILHTSGSTGKPKGVMYSHEGAIAFIKWCLVTFPLNSSDRFSSHAPFHFDLSIFDIFVCVAKSATLIIIDETTGKQPLLLAKLIADQQISVWYSTPTILNLITLYGKIERYDFSHLKLILFAGEVYPLHQFLNLYHKLPGVTYYNLYGPTETNVCCYFQINQIDEIEQSIPIGKVCEHYLSKINNYETKGELLINGNGLMLGYWNEASLTNEKYENDSNNIKWYKTGDIVNLNHKGQFVYNGRIDRMVKRNGYRIELDEIEQTILMNEHITSCAVVSIIKSENTTKIIAYIVSSNNSIKSIVYMKNLSTEILPIYMIPDEFIFLDNLPMTSNNKTDYQKLTAI
jgi:amino acid adenylation domain-containing protein